MALPLKTGADLYNQQLIRARLQNLGAQPNTADVGLGQVYFNTGTNTAASLRIGYCYETGSVPKFHHVANLEDVNRLEELISALSGSSSESVASVLGRVITLEGYFSNGKAKDADLLDGHNSDYFAEAATLNDLLEDYEAFKAVFADNSDDYINTWTEVKNFLDGIKNTEDLNAILLGINTELGKKANKATTLAGYGITDGIKYVNGIDLANGVPHNEAGYGYNQYGWKSNGPALSIGTDGHLMLLQTSTADGQLYHRYIGGDYKGAWYKILDESNYASELDTRYLQLTGGIISNTSNAPLKIKTDSESAWVGIEYLNNLGEREGSIGVYGGKPIFVPAALDKIWTILHSGNYSDLITDLNKNLNVPSITIGGIKLSVVEGQLQIEGDAYATGQLASGGIGSEGSGSGASGIVILEDWEKYDDTLAQVLGAGLGVGLRDKIAALESKATNVSVVQTLTSGKEIGAITIDGVATKLYAPATYAWSEITSKPISLGGYGIIDAVRFLSSQQGNYAIKTHFPAVLVGYTGEGKEGISGDYGILNIPVWSANTESSYYATQIYSAPNGANLTWRQVTASTNGAWKRLLDDSNYESIVGNKFLKLSGGNLTGGITISGGVGFVDNTHTHIFVNASATADYGTRIDHVWDGGSTCFRLDRNSIYFGREGEWRYILHAGNFNTYALPIAGGTLTGNLQIGANDNTAYNYLLLVRSGKALRINSHATAATIDYGSYSNGTLTSEHALSLSDYGLQYKVSGTVYDVIHSGNYGSVLNDAYFRVFSGGTYNANTISAGGMYRVEAQYEGGESWPIPPAYGNAIHVKVPLSDTAFQIAAPQYSTQRLFFRSFANSTQATQTWKEFAFTDSDITGNAASATKLQTARSLWGNSFDGTADINGDIHLAADKGIVASNGYAVLTAPSYLLLGYAQSELGQTTYLDGNDIYIRYGKNHVPAMYINSSGNVTIGASDLASTSKKLYVQGDALIERELFGANTADISVLGWRLFANADAAYLQAGKVTGSQNGNLYFTGLYGVTLSSFIVYSDSSEMKGRLLVNDATDDGVTALQVNGDIVIPNYTAYKAYDTNGGKMNLMYLDTSNRLRVYNDTMSFTPQAKVGIGTTTPQEKLHVVGNLYVTGNIIADGQVSSGGVAEEGTGGAVGGGSLDRVVFTIPAQTTSFTCEHNLGTREISVTIYEEGNDYQQVLADVYLDSTNVARIVFGSATDVAHKVVIIG